jgi:hypothetical protein
MDAVDGDVFRDRMNRFGQRLPPGKLRVVAQTGPVDGAEDNRLSFSQQNHAECAERIVDGADRLDPAAAERMAGGRRDIGGKRRQMERWHGEPS